MGGAIECMGIFIWEYTVDCRQGVVQNILDGKKVRL